jgi:CheY-like chemotaxis protein
LVVEDEILIRLMTSEGLREEGYHVIEAFNADEALVILETAVPDILVTDVRMPGSIDGLGLLRVVKEKLSTLPVILTSGHLDPAEAIAEGASQFVSKPYTVETLVREICFAIGESE